MMVCRHVDNEISSHRGFQLFQAEGCIEERSSTCRGTSRFKVSPPPPPPVHLELLISNALLGFSVVRLKQPTQDAVQRAHCAAMRFFEGWSSAAKAAYKVVVDTPGGGKALLGFNAPSPAKEVFRVHRAAPAMRYPSQDLEQVLLNAHRLLTSELKAYLRDVLAATIGDCAFDAGDTVDGEWWRAACEVAAEHDGAAESEHPMDLFYYYNSMACAHVSNCDAHVDRGLMHLIVLSPTCGLEVLDQSAAQEAETTVGSGGGQWRSLECRESCKAGAGGDMVHAEPLKDAVLLVNQELAEMSQRYVSARELYGGQGSRWRPSTRYRACVHRVAKSHTGCPRLSISFELRLPPSLAAGSGRCPDLGSGRKRQRSCESNCA